MKENEFIEIFKSLGYSVEKIKETEERSADFLIKSDEVKMIGELKTKGDSVDFIEEEELALKNEPVHMHFDSTARNNRLSGIVSDAIPQIKNMKLKYRSDFGVIIFDMLEPYAGNKVQKIVNTLYGRKFAIPLNTKKETGKWCYYCTYSDFYRYRDVLNAAFIISGNKFKVCVNNIAINYTEFLSSGLLKPLNGKYNDPQREIESGEALSVVGDVDRNNDQSIQEYFKEHFQFEAVTLIDFPSITASTRIDY
jgi:hypothetical protein